MAIEYPLDPDAVSEADDRFYETYPEMIDENGDRIPLSAQNDPSNNMHEDWLRFYNEELEKNREEDGSGEDEDADGDEDAGDDDTGDLPPAEEEEEEEFPRVPPDPCQDCEDSWISFDLMYVKESEDCEGIHYMALLTNECVEPTTGPDPRKWEPIPKGKCLFGEFDFHKSGKAAEKPDF